jgi:hypothetical protein
MMVKQSQTPEPDRVGVLGGLSLSVSDAGTVLSRVSLQF